MPPLWNLRSGLRCATFAFFIAASLLSTATAATPFIHPLFTSNMVLQRDASDPVWGWATSGTTVTVVVKDQSGATAQTKTATAGSDGRWQVEVGPFSLVTGNAAYSMTVSAAGQTTQNFTNILIGDVLLCTGQSNMDYNFDQIPIYNRDNEVADSANYPNIRHFYVNHSSTTTEQPTVTSTGWKVAGTTTVAAFTAAGYFTAREISKQQGGIPIGILCSAWAGTTIQLWTDSTYAASFADYTQALFDRLSTDSSISGGYNGMIAPLAPFRVKAVMWYQGEFNYTQPEQYSRLLPHLMSQWRTLLGQPNLPFLIVQLPGTDAYSGLRQAQFATVKADANSRLVVTNDIGEGALHPRDKQDVGLRAAWAAADIVYGQSGTGQGPLFNTATVSGNTIRCSFTSVGSGLMIGSKTINQTGGAQNPVQQLTGGTLGGFTIAGANRSYVAATATIDPATNTVIVSAASIANPVYVRYAWTGGPTGNLYKKVLNSGGTVVDGIPASPFTSDPVYRLSVNNGSGTGNYALNGTTTIAASSFTGQTFDHWTGDTGLLGNAGSATTTATVSSSYVSVFANYRVTAAPAGFQASADVGTISLSWTAMTGTHYTIKRATTSGGPYTTLATILSSATTTYTDSGLGSGKTYYYVISATSTLGEGPDSAPVAASTPAVVEGVKAVTGNAQVALSWNTFTNATSYTVKRATASGGPYTAIASGLTETSFTDHNVTSGSTYYYIVTATSAGGESPNSAEVSSVPIFLPAPLTDTDIGTVSLPGGAYAGPSGSYTVVGSGTGFGGASNSANFAYDSTAITGDFTLSAHITSLGTGAPEAGVMACSTLSADSPFARTYVTTTQTGYQARSAAGVTPGTSVTTSTSRWVRIVRTSNSCRGWISADGSNWTTQGTAVTVSGPVYVGLFVTAKSTTTSATVSFDNLTLSPSWTLQVPSVPSGMTASTTPANQRTVVSWDAAAGATSYDVKRASSSGGPFTIVASAINATSYTDTALASGSSYYYVISARNNVGSSANSSQTVADLAPPAITVPANIVAEATSTSGTTVTFTTSAMDDIDGSLTPANAPPSGSFFAIGATMVTTTATDSTGNMASKTFTVTVNWPTPANLAATPVSETQIRITWTASSANAAPYVIQRSPAGANTWSTIATLPAGSASYLDSSAAASTGYDYRIQSTGSGSSSAYANSAATTPAGIGDGIPGSWRYQYFGNGTTVTPASAADADPDSDGMTNVAEYLAGTVPTDPGSLLRISSIAISGANVQITFPSVADKSYVLEKTSALSPTPSWTTVQDNISGTGANLTIPDASAASDPRTFYRVRLK